jgi:hypothetical protein
LGDSHSQFLPPLLKTISFTKYSFLHIVQGESVVKTHVRVKSHDICAEFECLDTCFPAIQVVKDRKKDNTTDRKYEIKHSMRGKTDK